MINLKTTENSIKLLTKDKYCDDDINVTFEGGSGGIEEVTEFPTENVKDEVIYKRTYTAPSEMYIRLSAMGSEEPMALDFVLNSVFEFIVELEYYDVETLPSEMKESIIEDTFYIYVVNGVGYIKIDITGEGVTSVLTLGELFAMIVEMPIQDGGYVTSVGEITEDGVFAIKGQEKIEYGGKDISYNYTNNEWLNYSNVLSSVIDRSIMNLNLTNCRAIGQYAFYQSNIRIINAQDVTMIGSDAFRNCWYLHTVNTPNIKYILRDAFCACWNLTKVIIRQKDSICELGTNAFAYCYHFLGTTHVDHNPTGAKDGYIYVPRSLVVDYKSATNWCEYASQIRALEDYTVDGTIDGELDESKVNA